jgi:hypothetical protein
MEWVYFLGMAEWRDFDENSQAAHSLPFEEEKDPVSRSTPHTGDLFERNLLLSQRMET